MYLYFMIIRYKHHGGDIMYKAYKFRLYPNNKHKELIHKHLDVQDLYFK